MKIKLALPAFLCVLALLGAALIGWIMNIVTIFHTASDPITGMFIVRCIGIIVGPIGAILGWI